MDAIGLVEVSLALLMLTVMPRHRAMSGFGLDRPAVRRHQHRGHQPQRAEALRHGVGLHIAVVVLAGPDDTADHFSAAATMSSIRRCS